jgi:hypothetical protein
LEFPSTETRLPFLELRQDEDPSPSGSSLQPTGPNIQSLLDGAYNRISKSEVIMPLLSNPSSVETKELNALGDVYLVLSSYMKSLNGRECFAADHVRRVEGDPSHGQHLLYQKRNLLEDESIVVGQRQKCCSS